MRDLDVLAEQAEILRNVQRDVERQTAPGVERRRRIEIRERHRLGGVRLEQRALEDDVDVHVAAVDRQFAHHLGSLELAAQLKHGVDVDAAELVAKDLEAARHHVDLEIADGELVGAEAAAHLERPSGIVLQVERLDDDAIGRQLERGASVLVARAGGRHKERRVADVDGALRMRIMARAHDPDVDAASAR